MRRITILFLCILTTLCLCINASAATGISSMKSQVSVSSDSTCQVTAQLTIHLEQPVEKLYFPIPENATAVAVNGSRVLMVKNQNGVRVVDLSRYLSGMMGDISVTISYRLSELVTKNQDEILQLRLPLLNGFAYPIQSYEATVVMPGEITIKPSFLSGYHQANIEKDLEFSVEGATITCRTQSPLKDHETLAMTLPVNEEMFPQRIIHAPQLESTNTAAIVCGVLAALYWLLTLRFLLPLWPSRPTPPDGYTAGEMGSIVHLKGADLSLMVLSWAQQGYLLIDRRTPGQILLRKKMDMGNEQSQFQRKCFRLLFAKKASVDTSSAFYAQLCQKVAVLAPNVHGFVKKGSGNRKIFRILTALCGMFIGFSLGAALGAESAAPWLPAVLIGAFGLFSTYYCQTWAYSLIRPNRLRIILSAAMGVIWLILGIAAAQFKLALWAITLIALGGLLLAFSGRRTPEGRQAVAQVLGLRRYLRRTSAQEMARICQENPGYYHDLAPYAFALGANHKFAKAFGKQHTFCPYILDAKEPSMTANNWDLYLQNLLEAMASRSRTRYLEKIKKVIQTLKSIKFDD